MLEPAGVAAGALADVDVLIVPNGPAQTAFTALGNTGRAAVADWVSDGGRRFVGFAGGTELAVRLGLSTATLDAPKSDVPGSLFRVLVDGSSPLASGVGNTAYSFYAYDRVMRDADPAHVPVVP